MKYLTFLAADSIEWISFSCWPEQLALCSIWRLQASRGKGEASNRRSRRRTAR